MFLSSAALATTRQSRLALCRFPFPAAAGSLGTLSAGRLGVGNQGQRSMGSTTTIVEGVEFDTIAREWRCKWSTDNDKKSLADLQTALMDSREELKTIQGLKSVQRIVCGGCLDFKVVIAVEGDHFGDWQESGFAPEESFLDAIQAIEGVSVVETQTYTLMPVDL